MAEEPCWRFRDRSRTMQTAELAADQLAGGGAAPTVVRRFHSSPLKSAGDPAFRGACEEGLHRPLGSARLWHCAPTIITFHDWYHYVS